jgi:hypothetical protein
MTDDLFAASNALKRMAVRGFHQPQDPACPYISCKCTFEEVLMNDASARYAFEQGRAIERARHAALGVLLRQFVDYGNQQYVPDEDMESLMAEAETFLDHGLDALERETS